jgi:CarD family transcriptional regulator
MPDGLDLAVGDVAVYAGHGVARIVLRLTKHIEGEPHEFVVIECSPGLSITLPLAHARLRLRPLVTETEIGAVSAVLRAPTSTSSTENWLRRMKATRAKIAGGKAVELAEVVRDGALRGQQLRERGTPGTLSPNERELYLKARQLLAVELGASRGLDPAQADAWIETELATSTPS